ncbi:MAG: hypothetical protein ACRC1K_03230 [Planctomycetia bacterium]
MSKNDVLAAIRATRDELARRHGGDAWSLSAALAARSRAAGRQVVRFAPRRPSPPRAAAVELCAMQTPSSDEVPPAFDS